MIFEPRITKRSLSNTWHVELFNTIGPSAIGIPVTGLPDLITTPWALQIDEETSELQLYCQESGTWNRTYIPAHPVVDREVSESMRRVSLAFDQQARPVTAFEDNGMVFVTQFDVVLQEHVLRPGWAGRDPVLAFDGAWSLDSPSSDVVVFYLSSDRSRLLARLQRETFAIENEVHVFSEPAILDRVEALLWRYQVLYTTTAKPTVPLALLSDWYDAQFDVGADSTAVSAVFPIGGSYINPVTGVSAGDDEIGLLATFPEAGVYFSPLATFSAGSETLEATLEFPTGGTYVSTIITQGAGDDEIGLLATFPEAGVYFSPLATFSAGSETLEATLEFPTGGTYVKP